MLAPEARALLTDMQDQLIELYVAKDEAAGARIGAGCTTGTGH